MTSTRSTIVLAREAHRPGLARAVAAGDAERLRHGAYRWVEDGASTDRYALEHGRAVDRARALHVQLRAPHVFSHATAAMLWGCRLWRRPERTHVVQAYRASGRSAPDVARHRVEVPAGERAVIGGLPVTTLERTVVDVALVMRPLEALVIADSACRRGLDREAVNRILGSSRARNGRARARWVLDHADGGADSAWETWLRYLCLRAGLPRPVTQAPVATGYGVFHCDLGWPGHGVFAEFDGRIKYRDGALRPGHDATDELLREKRRYEAVRAAGVDPVRVMAAGRGGHDRVVERIAARFPAHLRRSFRVNPLLPPP
jgi:hypothetical protein